MPAIFRAARRHLVNPAASTVLSALRPASWCVPHNTNDSRGACGCPDCSSCSTRASSLDATGGHGANCFCRSCSLEGPQGCVSDASCQCSRCSVSKTSVSGQAWLAGVHRAMPPRPMHHTAMPLSRGLHSARTSALHLPNTIRCCFQCQKYPCLCVGSQQRTFSTVEQYQDEVDSINEAFVTARDEIEYAKEEAETVYFNEAHETAKAAVSDTLHLFQQLLDKLEESERGKLQRSMGLKMEQLKAELEVLDSLHA